MNIFVLDKDPVLAAQQQVDDHVRKMIIESAQMLANAYSKEELLLAPKTQKGTIRKYSYLHHPCSKWVLESLDNWLWLLNHAIALCEEYKYRENPSHFTESFIKWAEKNLPNLPNIGLTPFAQAMPEKHRNEDVVYAYRRYYIEDKKHLASWTKRDKPDWYIL